MSHCIFHNTILQIYQNKSTVLKNEEILFTEMLEGFYLEMKTRSFELNIMSYIFLMSVTYSTDTVIETVVKGVMLLV